MGVEINLTGIVWDSKGNLYREAFQSSGVIIVNFAHSGDSEFLEKLSQPNFYGFVHSVFKRTFNLRVVDNDELYTITNRELDNGPNTLITDAISFQNVSLEEHDKVFVNDGCLYIGNQLVISTEKCKKWSSVLPEFPEEITTLTRNLTIMKKYLTRHAECGGMKPDFSSENLFSKEVSRVLTEQSRLLLEELAAGRMTNALHHAKSLIGLGPGLTPSGDDFLVGLFAVMNVKGYTNERQLLFCEEVVKLAKDLTNEISYMALKKASTGKVRESIIQLISSLFYRNENELILSLNKVLAIGSTSGTDIALGLIAGLEGKPINFLQEVNDDCTSCN